MAPIELRDLTDADRDGAHRAARASTSGWPRGDVDDRSAFDAWLADQDADPATTVRAVVDGGTVVGIAAGFDTDGDREVALALVPGSGTDAATDALRLLTALEPERPLYACVPTDDDPSHAMLASVGFVESRRTDDEIVYVLPPTLE